MNLGLLDPFGQSYPEKIEVVLTPPSPAVTCSFNRWGTMLATGLADGRCVVWDFDTKGVSRELVGHVRPIIAVSWSCSGRRLVTASYDKRCILWDLLLQDGLPHAGAKTEVQFETPVHQALMHPRKNFVFVACPAQSLPVMIELLPLSDGSYSELRTTISSVAQADGAGGAGAGEDANAATASSGSKQPFVNYYVPCFSPNGDYLLLGDQKGTISLVDTSTLQLLSSYRISTGPVRTIKFPGGKSSNASSKFLVNVADRANHKIKVYAIDGFTKQLQASPTPLYEFQEVVNRYAWAQACFSADGDLVVAGSASPGEHKIYIWDSVVGSLMKILEGEGTREGLIDFSWHPIRPIIASIGTVGNVFVWSIRYQENWSAYAPDFKELEENVEYEEREDEFDIVPEVDISRRAEHEQDVVLDVDTIDGVVGGIQVSSGNDKEEPDLLFLPIILEDSVIPKIATDNNTVAATLIASRLNPSDSHTIEHDVDDSSSSSGGGGSKKRKLQDGE